MKKAAKIIMGFSILGFINALYLVYLYWQGLFSNSSGSFCDLTDVISCSQAANSPMAQYLGVPIGAIAMVVYPVIGFLGYKALTNRRPANYYVAIAIMATMGMTMNGITIYNEYRFLNLLCLVCVFCLVYITSILITALAGYHFSQKNLVKAAKNK